MADTALAWLLSLVEDRDALIESLTTNAATEKQKRMEAFRALMIGG